MRGSYEVRIRNKQKVSYRFTLRRNVTVVRGDSGTGKTTLYDMVATHMRGNAGNAVSVTCERPCVALTDMDWRHQLGGVRDSIVFVDEGARYVESEDFAAAVGGSSNYYVLFTRRPLHQLAYSVDEVYHIKTSGRIHTFVRAYPSRRGHAYGTGANESRAAYTVLLAEDSRSGLQFFESRFSDTGVSCTTSGGKSGIYEWLQAHLGQKVFVVADGAAFGSEASRVLALQAQHPQDIRLCLPESFEWLLMNSGVLRDDSMAEVLKDPAAHIDSSEYASWERFFTDLLKETTVGTPFEYHKSRLAEAWTVPANADKVMAQIAHGNVR